MKKLFIFWLFISSVAPGNAQKSSAVCEDGVPIIALFLKNNFDYQYIKSYFQNCDGWEKGYDTFKSAQELSIAFHTEIKECSSLFGDHMSHGDVFSCSAWIEPKAKILRSVYEYWTLKKSYFQKNLKELKRLGVVKVNRPDIADEVYEYGKYIMYVSEYPDSCVTRYIIRIYVKSQFNVKQK